MNFYSIIRLAAIFLLVTATFSQWPYGFYQIMRWIVCISAGMTASKQTGWRQGLFIALAILFNPITPIHFEREVWQVIDFLAAGAFVLIVWPVLCKR